MTRLALLIALTFCSLAQAKYPPAVQPEAKSYHAAVVRVDAGRGIGSGTLIAINGGKGIVVTADHVVAEGPPYNVQFPGFDVGSKVRVIAKDHARDVAALEVDVPPGIEPIPLAWFAAQQGDPVELCGYGGGKWGYKAGEVIAYHRHRDTRETDLAITAIATPGYSGGAMLAFEDGEPRLAGVVWGGPNKFHYDRFGKMVVGPMRHAQGTCSWELIHWMRKAVSPTHPYWDKQ